MYYSMRKFIILIVVALLIGAATFPAGHVQARAQAGVLASILDKMTAAGDNLRTLKASLRQQKINTQLGIKDAEESGTLFYHPLKGGQYQLRIDYVSPEPKVVVVDGDKFMLYQPNLKQIIRSTLQGYAENHGESGLSFR